VPRLSTAMPYLLQGITSRYQNFDFNMDGRASITGLNYLNFEQLDEEIPNNLQLIHLSWLNPV
jgi:hypothetical protein